MKCCFGRKNYPFLSQNLSLFKSFLSLNLFLILTPFYRLTVGVEGYCRTRSHIMPHTLGRNSLVEGSARRSDLCLITHIIHKRQAVMPSAWFEPAIPACERPQTHSVNCAATGAGCLHPKIGISLPSAQATVNPTLRFRITNLSRKRGALPSDLLDVPTLVCRIFRVQILKQNQIT
jgi:hypothetical protein